jgi:hypothetical protein
MDDQVQFAVLLPETLVADLRADAPEWDARGGPPDITVHPAEKSESALGFDPVITPTLVWVVLKFGAAAVAGGALKSAGSHLYEKLKGESTKKNMFEMVIRLPDGSRITLKGTDADEMAAFAKTVAERQGGKRG